ncbi:MAG: AmmeMemoRadiSam system protein A [Candidatus Dadabacteria bacterium]|nr:AmmeMemoRadiSam system protein A [Candidatus Dadabacteria bacterium]NIS08887.1 AmmeMemoRadiSam system protein A [Candidatus Dadabacteria bacterium]NIV42586.1 AmmeMemoRadiSam system protein A [Candidatus Dadabacteria bacterium]NIY22230.1 AmmeMemoRadiSam system protein A [Candidatus Dadabacteria bacterium]
MPDSDPRLTEDDKKTLTKIARNTLKSFLETNEIPEVISDRPSLLVPRATFVTLRNSSSGDLRGCKGEIFPSRPLAQAVQHTAISSATSDPRFVEVTAGELDDISIEISVLKPIRPIKPGEVVIGKHGLIAVKGDNTGVLLPHVPVIYNLDKETYLKEICLKAGLSENALEDNDTALYGFEAEVFEEAVL